MPILPCSANRGAMAILGSGSERKGSLAFMLIENVLTVGAVPRLSTDGCHVVCCSAERRRTGRSRKHPNATRPSPTGASAADRKGDPYPGPSSAVDVPLFSKRRENRIEGLPTSRRRLVGPFGGREGPSTLKRCRLPLVPALLWLFALAAGATPLLAEGTTADGVQAAVDVPAKPSRERALIGLLENEQEAMVFRIERLQLALGERRKDDASMTADERLERDRQERELDSLERRLREIDRELADLGGGEVGVGGPFVFVPSARPPAAPSVFIPAAKPAEAAPEIDLAGATRTAALAPDAAGAEAAGPDTRAERLRIQEALVLVAGYDAAIDGAFGPRTETAIGAFQRTLGAEPTGRLTEEERNRLLAEAAAARQNYAFRDLEDEAIGYSLVYPAKALSEETPAADGYRLLADAEGTARLQVTEVGSRNLKTLFTDLTRHDGVGYSRFGGSWFVASGEVDDEMFYSMARLAETGSIVVHLTYPLTERAFWDPYTVMLYNSFRVIAPTG